MLKVGDDAAPNAQNEDELNPNKERPHEFYEKVRNT